MLGQLKGRASLRLVNQQVHQVSGHLFESRQGLLDAAWDGCRGGLDPRVTSQGLHRVLRRQSRLECEACQLGFRLCLLTAQQREPQHWP